MRILCDKLGEGKAPNSIEHGVDILRTAFMKRSNSLLVSTKLTFNFLNVVVCEI